MNKPKFIAIEGGEGSGKSSLVAELKKEFGDTIVTSREPGGSPFAEVIRDTALKHKLAAQTDPATMLCLMFAARFDHVKNVIVPTLQSGKHAITDRFDASSYAYQIVAEETGGRLEQVFWDLRKVLPILPDLYVFVDVEPSIGLGRRGVAGGSNHLDERSLEFHQKVRNGFIKFMGQVTKSISIDANRPFKEVRNDFLSAVRAEISKP